MKLIDKDNLVSEIDKLKGKVSDSSSYCNGWQHALRMLELYLNTLEVKEVDLKKELNEYGLYHNYAFFNRKEMVDFAKHFFELGMAVGNKAQKGE